MRPYVIGIDVGGTNIKAGLVTPSGKVRSRTILPTKSFARSKKKLINTMVACVEDMMQANQLRRNDILGIGIGLPGLIDTKKGMVNLLVNIPGWKNVPLKRIIEKTLGIPVFIDNDANLIALGEWKFGAGRGFRNLVSITIGTGVGGGLIIDNRLYRGASFSAGEVGHIPLSEEGFRCLCGGRGCLERTIGNRYLLQRGKKIFRNQNITLEEITNLARKGNKKAIRFWMEVAIHLGNGLSGVVNLLNPQCIIIGGGIANAHQYLLKTVHQTIRKRAMSIPAKTVKIRKAKLGTDAGIIGTQVLVKDALLFKK